MPQNLMKSVINWVIRIESKVNNVLALFSMIAVALVVSTELVGSHARLPLLHTAWADFHVFAHTIIWIAFVVSFFVYCLLSMKPIKYVRHHILELLVCVCWVPHYTEGSLHILSSMLVFSNLVPMEVMQLIGTLAHAWRVLKWTGQRFRAHPVFVTGAAAILLITSAAALLQHFEPDTYHNFWEAAWFALTTVTTIGFGPAPVTSAGKIITTVLIISGLSLAGVFIGLITEMVRNQIFNRPVKFETVTLSDLKDEQMATKQLVINLQAENRELKGLVEKLLSRGQSSPLPDTEKK